MIDLRYETESFYGAVWTMADGANGYFEHKEHGDEYGGGLWLEWRDRTLTLVDYDGVEYLPDEVISELESKGFNMSWGKHERV